MLRGGDPGGRRSSLPPPEDDDVVVVDVIIARAPVDSSTSISLLELSEDSVRSRSSGMAGMDGRPFRRSIDDTGECFLAPPPPPVTVLVRRHHAAAAAATTTITAPLTPDPVGPLQPEWAGAETRGEHTHRVLWIALRLRTGEQVDSVLLCLEPRRCEVAIAHVLGEEGVALSYRGGHM